MEPNMNIRLKNPPGKAGKPAEGKNGSQPLSRTIKDDFLASIVVFLVALPLCMGIAIASGIPPERAAATGIITGIIAGLVVGWISGSPMQVSGPAAGLSVIILEFITQKRAEFLGRQADLSSLSEEGRRAIETLANEYALGVLGLVVLLAGLIQFVAGLFRLGQWFRAVSPAVIQGMLAGIGVLIFASQFHVMIDDRPREDGLANLLSVPEAIWKAGFPANGYESLHFQAACIGVLTILGLIAWKFLGPKKLKFLPPPLIGVVIATVLTVSFGLTIQHISMPDSLLDAIQIPTPTFFLEVWDWSLLVPALTLAVIASAETLLCATAVDQLHRGPRTNYDRELTAQGFGNFLCGLVGGLPMTGVIVRSAANIEAGAKTRLSAIFHGAWLLVFVCLVPFVLELIPTAALAAILVYTGYKLMNVQAVKRLWKYGKGEVAIYAATVIGIVATDLLKGVLLGVALSAIKLLYTFSHLSVRLEVNEEKKQTILRLKGAATFIRLPKLAAALDGISPDTELHVHIEHLNYIDHACLDLIMNWEKQHHDAGGRLVIDWDSLTARFHHARRKALTGTWEHSSNGVKEPYFSEKVLARKEQHSTAE